MRHIGDDVSFTAVLLLLGYSISTLRSEWLPLRQGDALNRGGRLQQLWDRAQVGKIVILASTALILLGVIIDPSGSGTAHPVRVGLSVTGALGVLAGMALGVSLHLLGRPQALIPPRYR